MDSNEPNSESFDLAYAQRTGSYPQDDATPTPAMLAAATGPQQIWPNGYAFPPAPYGAVMTGEDVLLSPTYEYDGYSFPAPFSPMFAPDSASSAGMAGWPATTDEFADGMPSPCLPRGLPSSALASPMPLEPVNVAAYASQSPTEVSAGPPEAQLPPGKRSHKRARPETIITPPKSNGTSSSSGAGTGGSRKSGGGRGRGRTAATAPKVPQAPSGEKEGRRATTKVKKASSSLPSPSAMSMPTPSSINSTSSTPRLHHRSGRKPSTVTVITADEDPFYSSSDDEDEEHDDEFEDGGEVEENGEANNNQGGQQQQQQQQSRQRKEGGRVHKTTGSATWAGFNPEDENWQHGLLEEDQPPVTATQRERNRKAATKCRAKTKAAIRKLEEDERAASDRRLSLSAERAALKEEVLSLRLQVLEHSRCANPDPNIANYLRNAARTIGESGGRAAVWGPNGEGEGEGAGSPE